MSGESLKGSFLFEVSWEVCNKVGGIYTVLRSKLSQVVEFFGNRYILIGPLLSNNRHFIEDYSPFSETVKKKLLEININCKVGYWDVDAKPTVILIDFRNRYNASVLLYNLWSDYGIDSLASNYEYIEPILFATAAAEVIATLAKELFPKNLNIIAHFHEWLCGAGILYLKKHYDYITTIFTIHATVLGRALSAENKLISNLPRSFDPMKEARKFGGSVSSKHMLEAAAAKNATYFTAVSEVTAIEALNILGRYPDKVLLNGLDVSRKQQMVSVEKRTDVQAKLRSIAANITGTVIPENSLLWLTSGRYEFHNKGFDVLLKSLADLEKKLALEKETVTIVVFILVAVNSRSAQDVLLTSDPNLTAPQKAALGIATHKIAYPDSDPIIKAIYDLNLKQTNAKIHIVYSDAYLNGSDGVFNMIYEQIIAACDLSIFPSFYEPWGYTPLESIAYGVPTVTTDLSGFGYWINNLEEEHHHAVYVLARKIRANGDFESVLEECLLNIIKQPKDAAFIEQARRTAQNIASLADWKYFYQKYLEAYEQALNFNMLYHTEYGAEEDKNYVTTIREVEAVLPRFRQFQYECTLPDSLCYLRDFAYNFWWSWHEDAKQLFSKIDPLLWGSVRHNPVNFLNLVPNAFLQKVISDKDYMKLYHDTLARFELCTKKDTNVVNFCSNALLDYQHPLAYFCMEYGIDECLPIYSGGLGILAGDYLKALSEMRVPAVAIGLFYKQGYFFQNINPHGDQVAIYETWDVTQIPMRPARDDSGKLILVGVEISGRTVYVKAWEVKIGHVSLYLLDSDVPENAHEDRDITNSLYGGSRENRLLQEMLLGIGGVRLILEKLNLQPAIFHLNEGHSAFLLLERIRNYHSNGFTFEEALEVVRSSSVFTTHTPVSAGNETFSEDLIRKYFMRYVNSLGISIDKLLSLAREPQNPIKVFSMTALALRLTLHANAVSPLHEKVAKLMWKNIWPNLLEAEIPILHVTNGIHIATWLGAAMKELYDNYLKINWDNKDGLEDWQNIVSVPSEKLWQAHQEQKEKLLELVKDLILHQYSLRNENKQLITSSLSNLDSDVLLLGLARRFTGYKRNDLILKDKERLASILNNEQRPVVLIVAGKAHPADASGSNLIREFIEIAREKIFNGHIIFLEEYNIGLAKGLMQGVDVWINTPILGREACGTSGMKVGINGGLNFSTRDGWWHEAYDKSFGWEIQSLSNIEDIEKRNDMENMLLLTTLEKEIANLYYDKKGEDFNSLWVTKMKASIAMVGYEYSAFRMAKEYMEKLYCPAILQTEKIQKNNFSLLKDIVAWKNNAIEKFNTVKIKTILVSGIKEGKIVAEGQVKIKVLLFPGMLKSEEIAVELVLIKKTEEAFMSKVVVVPLNSMGADQSGILTFEGDFKVEDTGFYSYGVRVFATNPILLSRYDTELVYWG